MDIHDEPKNKITTKFTAKGRFCDSLIFRQNILKIGFSITCLFSIILILVIFPNNSFASQHTIIANTSYFFGTITTFLENIIFYEIPIIKIPALVLWLAVAGLFFSLKLRFVNLRLIKHALQTIAGKYDKDKSAKGSITPRQALFTTISATVGIGNIAGVAVAISIGGPGAVIWMMIMAFFGMATIFSEVLMSQKYRISKKLDGKEHFYGGPSCYLRDGLKDIGLAKIGIFLSIIFSVFCLFGTVGVSIFQANQLTQSITSNFTSLSDYKLFISFIIALLTGAVLIGGIVRIAHIAEKIVPTMAILYVSGCIVVLVVNFHGIPEAIAIMFTEAFNFNDLSSISGGFLGALIAGVKRAVFSNEAGIGTSPIANAATKSAYPTRQASVASLTPIIDTIIICFMTGIVIVVTKAYQIEGLNGIMVTTAAFQTVTSWFSYVIAIAAPLFAYSTIITYGYYGRTAWNHLFKYKTINIFYVLYCICLFLSSAIKFDLVIRLADVLVLSMAIPNLIGLYLLSGMIKKEAYGYFKRFKKGEFK